MKIELLEETHIRVSDFSRAEFDIQQNNSDVFFGAMPMFVTALALCTFTVLASYGKRIDAGTEDISMQLKWKYGDKPHRISDIDLNVKWPQVPESRLDAAMRAAAQCTIHKTLEQGVAVETDIFN